MINDWYSKLGDRIIRPLRIKRFRLRRVLGVPAVFSTGYGNVGSSIYYVLGIVNLVVMGAIPIALGTIRDNQTKANVEGMSRIQQLR